MECPATYLQHEVRLPPASRPPSSSFDFRLYRKVFTVSALNWRASIARVHRWNFIAILFTARDIWTSGLTAAIIYLRLPVTFGSASTVINEMLNLGNGKIAFGILVQGGIEPEITWGLISPTLIGTYLKEYDKV